MHRSFPRRQIRSNPTTQADKVRTTSPGHTGRCECMVAGWMGAPPGWQAGEQQCFYLTVRSCSSLIPAAHFRHSYEGFKGHQQVLLSHRTQTWSVNLEAEKIIWVPLCKGSNRPSLYNWQFSPHSTSWGYEVRGVPGPHNQWLYQNYEEQKEGHLPKEKLCPGERQLPCSGLTAFKLQGFLGVRAAQQVWQLAKAGPVAGPLQATS